jgi:GTP cyclohydrolase I
MKAEGFPARRKEVLPKLRNDVVQALKEVFDSYARYVRVRAEKRCVVDEESKTPFTAVDTELSTHVETLRRLGETIADLAKD